MSLLDPEARKQLKLATRTGAVGIEMALALVLGYFGGRWLDAQLDTAPVLSWVGLAFGLAAGANALYRVARRTRLDRL